MPNWLIKSAIHRVISWLPWSQYWNELMQTHLTRSLNLTSAHVVTKLDECRRYCQSLQVRRPGIEDFVVVEIGTGWYPTAPIGLYLCGAKETHTYDIEALLTSGRIKRVVELVLELERSGELARILPACLPERVARLGDLLRADDAESPASMLARVGVKVVIGDASGTGLPDQSVDLIFSSVVLAHIPPVVLSGMLDEVRRIAKPGGLMCHIINLGDQYSYFDPSITRFNYLKYTPGQWRWLNSPMIPQNRLRISDYRRMFEEFGFRIFEEDNTIGDESDLRQTAIASEFTHYQEEDLLVIYTYMACYLEGVESAASNGSGQ